MTRIQIPLIGHRPLTGFDYLALTGFAINMAVILLIVVHWMSN